MVERVEEGYEQITGEQCPVCGAKTLTLTEAARDIPFFGTCYLFSMDCSGCGYHKADVEAAATHHPVNVTFILENEEDLKVRVVKSSNATVKIGTVGTIEPGEAANGYVTNIEGLLNRIKTHVEHLKQVAQDEGDQATVKKAKSHLKRLRRALGGEEPLKIVLRDPTGNSAIISEKTRKR